MQELVMLRSPNKPVERNNRVVNVYLFLIFMTAAMNALVSLSNG